jgi:hypothetical protein
MTVQIGSGATSVRKPPAASPQTGGMLPFQGLIRGVLVQIHWGP